MHPQFIYLHSLRRLNEKYLIDLRMIRDDWFPKYFGGNKARKILKIINEIERQGCNAVVTTGGIQSNHARVVALVAAERNWPCILILHGEGNEKFPVGNEKIMRLVGAKIKIVDKTEIAYEMKKAFIQLQEKGHFPYEVPGGGHCLTGALSFVEAIEQLKIYCEKNRWYPDYIVHASGTGTTQAGILGGIKKIGWDTHVIGISVARLNPYGKNIVLYAYREIMAHLNLAVNPDDIDFRDDWICGGYEKANLSIYNTIGSMAKLEGLILDPTYTGKAFKALLDIINSGEISRKSKVIFWHTGSLMNLLASNQPMTVYQS